MKNVKLNIKKTQMDNKELLVYAFVMSNYNILIKYTFMEQKKKLNKDILSSKIIFNQFKINVSQKDAFMEFKKKYKLII